VAARAPPALRVGALSLAPDHPGSSHATGDRGRGAAAFAAGAAASRVLNPPTPSLQRPEAGKGRRLAFFRAGAGYGGGVLPAIEAQRGGEGLSLRLLRRGSS